MLNCLKIRILPLLFLTEDKLKSIAWFSMVFSDAQPIQFWLVECDTYNQHVHDGVFHRCFCQPWGCDDTIKVQFTELAIGSPDTGEDFTLSIRNEQGNELLSLPFEKSGFLELASLSEATNYDNGGESWTIDADPNITVDDFTKILRLAFSGAYEDVDYTFHYRIIATGGAFTDSDITIGLYDSSMTLIDFFDIHVPDADTFEDDVILNGGIYEPAYIGISVVNNLSDVGIEVEEFDLLTTSTNPIVYNLSFVPSDASPDICNQLVQFFVVNSSDEDIAKSDCQDISSSTKNTMLITYSNHENVFGLVYDNQTPEFNLRIPATFFHQRFPGEDEVMELSYSLVTLNSSLRRQRLLETDFLPYYFHEKIIMVLQHQFVEIINKSWVKQEGYEIAEGNRMYPEKKAKVWLGEREFVQRNVL